VTTAVELTRFRVSPEHATNLLAARGGMIADFQADRDGFLGAKLVQLSDGEWLDIVEWRSPADFAASRAKGGNLPGIQAFFALIDDIVSMEEGTLR
jgi:quinol monooxygenase YgiN